jgi:selenocysteine-specific elongation factor
VRLWVDRAFTIRGAGLVVTGTLPAGTVRVGDTLELARTGAKVVVREVQTLNQHTDAVSGVARVALNLRLPGRVEIARGDALLTPGSYRCTAVADVRTRHCTPSELPRELLVHVGTATVLARLRPIGPDTARLFLDAELPLRVGDRVVLRTSVGVAGGAVLLDVDPAVLNRRGATRRRASELDSYDERPDGEAELERRGIVREGTLRAIGVVPPRAPLVGDWLVSPSLAAELTERIGAMVSQRSADPSAPPLPVEEARKALELPDVRLVPALVPSTLVIRDGVILPADAPDTLAPLVRSALSTLESRLTGFVVPTSEELAGLGLRAPEIAAAVRAHRLVRLAPDVVLLPATLSHAVSVLAALEQPFTAGAARDALGTNRKVIVPLLEHLAREGITRRLPDGSHRLIAR